MRKPYIYHLVLLSLLLCFNNCTGFSPISQSLYEANSIATLPTTTPVPNSTLPSGGVSQKTMNTGVNLLTFCNSYHSHWTYPADLPKLAWDYDYYHAKGFTIFRVMILWESLQPTLNGPLTSWQVSCLHDALNTAAAHHVKISFDIHNYARYVINNQGGTLDQTDLPNDSDQAKLGTSDLPISALTNLWLRLATEFHGDPGLAGYDLMNEPHDLGDATIWPTAAQAAVNAIRTVDQVTPIKIEGYQWSDASNWVANNPGLNIQDPSHSIIYSAHLYFDNGSGLYTGSYDSYGTTPSVGVDRAKPFVTWLQTNGFTGEFGEFGAPSDDPRWLTVLDNFMSYITSNHVGGTAFSGGWLLEPYGQANNWYALDPLGAQTLPANPVDRGAMAVLGKYPSASY